MGTKWDYTCKLLTLHLYLQQSKSSVNASYYYYFILVNHLTKSREWGAALAFFILSTENGSYLGVINLRRYQLVDIYVWLLTYRRINVIRISYFGFPFFRFLKK